MQPASATALKQASPSVTTSAPATFLKRGCVPVDGASQDNGMNAATESNTLLLLALNFGPRHQLRVLQSLEINMNQIVIVEVVFSGMNENVSKDLAARVSSAHS